MEVVKSHSPAVLADGIADRAGGAKSLSSSKNNHISWYRSRRLQFTYLSFYSLLRMCGTAIADKTRLAYSSSRSAMRRDDAERRTAPLTCILQPCLFYKCSLTSSPAQKVQLARHQSNEPPSQPRYMYLESKKPSAASRRASVPLSPCRCNVGTHYAAVLTAVSAI